MRLLSFIKNTLTVVFFADMGTNWDDRCKYRLSAIESMPAGVRFIFRSSKYINGIFIQYHEPKASIKQMFMQAVNKMRESGQPWEQIIVSEDMEMV